MNEYSPIKRGRLHELPPTFLCDEGIKVMYEQDDFHLEFKNYVGSEFTVGDESSCSYVQRQRFHDDYAMKLLNVHVVENREMINDSLRDVILPPSIELCRVLVMPMADRSLSDIIAKERITGQNNVEIRSILYGVASCLQHIHTKGFVHGDVKKENFVQVGSTMKVIDFDTMVEIGETFVTKYTSTVIPPERARLLLRKEEEEKISKIDKMELLKKEIKDIEKSLMPKGTIEWRHQRKQITTLEEKLYDFEMPDTNNAGKQHVVAYVHHDVWSYGLIAYEMLTSQALFPSDANGRIVQEEEHRLCSWTSLRTENLEHVLKNDTKSDTHAKHLAQELLKNCLEGDPTKRYQSMSDVLNDPYFKTFE